MSLPGYLRDQPVDGITYGTLSYNRRSKCWTIKGEPCVTELAKRLFPGCAGHGRGEARFTAHRRIIGDLNWLMLRYPLRIAERDQSRWESALEDAREWAARRAQAVALPDVAQPPKAYFDGDLMPFQQKGLAYLLANERALLADEMGLGKTVQAIALMASTRQFPALLVVPPHLLRNWHRELTRFLRLPDGLRVHVIKGLKPYDLPEADVYLIHYLLLRGWKGVLPELGFRTLLFDEVQELRRAGTEKYSAASLISSACERVVGLSGTPIYNRGGEIWNVVNILDFHFLGSWESFSREWCDGYGRGIVLKPELLGEHLRREGLMLRRTKAEVLPELPPKRRLVQEIDADDALYEQMTRDFLEKLRVLETDETLTPSMRAILEEQVSQEERQATGLAKATYVAAFVKALLEGDEKVLLFAHHHAVMDAYKKELRAYKPVFITGRESDEQKDRAVHSFMRGDTNLCCISLRSASGLNLQRATCVVFGELDWSPAVHSQAEDRAHRIGQEDSLLCYYLVSPAGSDREMQEALGLKVSQFLALMGDQPTQLDDTIKQESIARAHVRSIMERRKRG
ncbi:DEAD/DEAH box helicase [Eubacteriales bacterium OttesenSCG-928-A19]|nr:DEAD/DEAH box helicase [Eubacteriales bacterium OttesenSCG-928-A19]